MVFAAVVDDDNLKSAGEVGYAYGVETLREQRLHVVGGDDDRESGHGD